MSNPDPRQTLVSEPAELRSMARLADMLWQNGEYANALNALHRLAIFTPDHRRVLEMTADTLLKLGRLEDATNAARRGLLSSPSSADTFAAPRAPCTWLWLSLALRRALLALRSD